MMGTVPVSSAGPRPMMSVLGRLESVGSVPQVLPKSGPNRDHPDHFVLGQWSPQKQGDRADPAL